MRQSHQNPQNRQDDLIYFFYETRVKMLLFKRIMNLGVLQV